MDPRIGRGKRQVDVKVERCLHITVPKRTGRLKWCGRFDVTGEGIPLISWGVASAIHESVDLSVMAVWMRVPLYWMGVEAIPA